jgi:hypothetical protein
MSLSQINMTFTSPEMERKALEASQQGMCNMNRSFAWLFDIAMFVTMHADRVYTSSCCVIAFDEAVRLNVFSEACRSMLRRYWETAFTRDQLVFVCQCKGVEHARGARKSQLRDALVAAPTRPVGSYFLDQGREPEVKLDGGPHSNNVQLPTVVNEAKQPEVEQPEAKQPEVKQPEVQPNVREQLRGAMSTNEVLLAHIAELRKAIDKPNKASSERDRIAKGAYEELHKFLHRKRTGSRELCEDDEAVYIGQVSLTVNGTGRAPKIKSMQDWLEAWSYYQAAFCTMHPHRIMDLHEHFRWMVKAPYADNEKMAYDRALRAKHVGPDAKWGELDMRLFSYHVSQAREQRRQPHQKRANTGPGSNRSNKRPKSTPTQRCNGFSATGKCSYGVHCRFTHDCSICKGEHFWKQCPTARSSFSR